MANQHLNNKTLIERYVLKQLSEDELLEFRGAMMFDSELRQQVAEQQQVFHALQTLSKEPEFALTASNTSTLSYTRKWLLAGSMAAILGIVVFFTYDHFNGQILESKASPIEEPTAQVEQTDTQPAIVEAEEKKEPIPEKIEEIEKIAVPTKPPKVEQPAKPPVASPILDNSVADDVIEKVSTPTLEEEPEEEMIFAAAMPNTADYETNEILEEFVNTSTRGTKSPDAVIIKVDFENGTKLKLSEDNKVQLKFEGVVQDADDVEEIGPYTFKIYSNDMDDFIEQRPLYDEDVVLNKLEIKFDKTFELKEGLYYFILQDEDDMRYTGKFFVEK